MAGFRAPIRLPVAYRDLLPTFDAIQREVFEPTQVEIRQAFEAAANAQFTAEATQGQALSQSIRAASIGRAAQAASDAALKEIAFREYW